MPATRQRGPVKISVPQDAWDEALAEIVALRKEGREIGALLPSARAVHCYIATVGESIEAEQHAARIYYLVDRASRRHGADQ